MGSDPACLTMKAVIFKRVDHVLNIKHQYFQGQGFSLIQVCVCIDTTEVLNWLSRVKTQWM